MIVTLWLFAIQGMIGAFDTLYYHEWKARLPARGMLAASELKLHAGRDFLYALLFASLPWVEWHGRWAAVLAGVIAAEITLTLWDFIAEVAVRKPLGDVYAGERVTHAVMGIVYGAAVANMAPVLTSWWLLPTELVISPAGIPVVLRGALEVMAVGVFLSGVRDLYASCGLPGGGWPWMLTSPLVAE